MEFLHQTVRRPGEIRHPMMFQPCLLRFQEQDLPSFWMVELLLTLVKRVVQALVAQSIACVLPTPLQRQGLP